MSSSLRPVLYIESFISHDATVWHFINDDKATESSFDSVSDHNQHKI